MLVRNDGLLAHHIALSQKITYGESLIMIEREVNNWLSDLKKNKAVEVEGIGKMYHDAFSNLQFRNDSDLNFLIDSYGLTSFQSLPVVRSSNFRVKPELPSEKEKPVRFIPAVNSLAKYSVAAAILSIVALTAYKMQWNPEIHLDKISLNPFKTERPVYEFRTYPDLTSTKEETSVSLNDILDSADGEVYHYETGIKDLSERLTIRLHDEIVSGTIAETGISRGKYHVVGGCFSIESNASGMVKKLREKGYPADMSVQHHGLHVVSYQSFSDITAAKTFLSTIKKTEDSNAWLLVK